MDRQNRREFIKLAGVGAAASALPLATSQTEAMRMMPANRDKVEARQKAQARLKLGLASYTCRNLNLEKTLAACKKIGLKYVCFKSMHLPLNASQAQIQGTLTKVKKAGLALYGGGVIYMKNEAQVKQGFEYAQAAGMDTIVGVADPPLLPLVDRMVKQYNIKLAIHNHGPGDKTYPTPESAYVKVKKFDKRIGLCMDIGHTQRYGADPSDSAERFADRLHDIHIKDVSEASAKGHCVEMGRGVIDIPRFLKTLLKINYSGIVSYEYEKDANDPIPGLAESVGYTRGVLTVI
jgi:inosose dehydratase